jgi:ribose transport system ATP-binding protein
MPPQLSAATPGEPGRLTLRDISKRFGSTQALDQVSFAVGQGEVVALLGENGAGKSTIVKILAGLVAPDAGEVRIDGRRVRPRSNAEAQSAGVAVVTQEFSLVPSLTIAENIALGRVGSDLLWKPRRAAEQAEQALSAIGLGGMDPSRRVEQLQVAERQLVEIARAVSRSAKVLILDEPTAALADNDVERVLTTVRRLADAGQSVIYVTHRLPEVFQISDRIQVMRNGRALPAVSTRSVGVDDVVSMMLGRELKDMYPARPAAGSPDEVLTVQDLSAPGLAEPVSFRLRSGQILGLIGQIGSGASVVAQALAGVLPRTSGDVRVRGGSRVDLRDRARGLRQGVAYCSADRQADGIFPRLSVMQNLSSPWLDRVSKRGWISDRAERAVAASVAADFAVDVAKLPAPASSLSGGNQQKVALGKWLGSSPCVLIADEPTRGVDVGARTEIYRHLRNLADRGIAVVISSSDTAEVLGLSDVIGTFYHGSLTSLREAGQWTEQDILWNVMHSGRGESDQRTQVPR